MAFHRSTKGFSHVNSLSNRRVAQVLDKLHEAAEVADRDFMATIVARLESSGEAVEDAVAQLVADEQADYRTTYRAHTGHRSRHRSGWTRRSGGSAKAMRSR